VPPAISGLVMGTRRLRSALVLGRRLPVEQSAFDIHSQLGHLFESLGSDEVLPVTLGLVFYNPLQLLRGFDKDIADVKWIDWSQTVLVFVLGFHLALPSDDGKMLTLSCKFSGRVERTDQQQAMARRLENSPTTMLQKSTSRGKIHYSP
jgi:hypothetical protein